MWPRLWTFINDFCKSCTTCMCSKSQHHKLYRFLKQLLIPEQPWNSISMDFIKKLSQSSGYSAILMVVNWLTKQVIFIPTHDTITSTELAKLFILHVFSKHSVPSHVTFNWGSEFMSHFFEKALDMTLHFTSGYHPEGDRQTKYTNQTLEQYIPVYSNYQQDNWSELLPLAEFAYNNITSTTTGISPFFVNKGYHLNLTVHPEWDLASSQAWTFAINLDQIHQELKEHIKNAQSWYQVSADSHWNDTQEFETGCHTFVKVQFFQTTWPSKKLAEKYLGPFKVIAWVSSHSYTLRLPDSMCAVHPVFHVSMLKPATPNPTPNQNQLKLTVNLNTRY